MRIVEVFDIIFRIDFWYFVYFGVNLKIFKNLFFRKLYLFFYNEMFVRLGEFIVFMRFIVEVYFGLCILS